MMRRRGLTIIELAISMAIIAVVLSALIPALAVARTASRRAHCGENLRVIGLGWADYMDANDGLPDIAFDPAWQWGGVKHQRLSGRPFIDYNRPISRALLTRERRATVEHYFCCPADTGITGDSSEVGTAGRTCYQAFGTSYRANSRLFDPRHRDEAGARPSEVVLLGDAVWFEAIEQTGRAADWHGVAGGGNMLRLDGSIEFMLVDADSKRMNAMFLR